MEQSVFTRIINGEIPSYKIYEDDKTIAILDIHPVLPGHVLVISKQQVDHFEELPDDVYHAVWSTVKKIAIHQRKTLRCGRVNVSVVGTDVPHAHVHLIPFEKNEDLHIKVDLNTKPDSDALLQMVDRLKFHEENYE